MTPIEDNMVMLLKAHCHYRKDSQPAKFLNGLGGLASSVRKSLTESQHKFLRDLFFGGRNGIGPSIVFRVLDDDACTSSAGAKWRLANLAQMEKARGSLFWEFRR